MRSIKRFLFLSPTVLLVILFSNCEINDRFYRPNMHEKLCSVGIIDADDTIRYISVEKSFQIEYSEEVKDSLREFSFKISSSGKEFLKRNLMSMGE